MNRQTVSEAKRRRVAQSFRYRCAYCLTSQRIIGPLLEIDHVFPESRGGSSEEKNLALACPICNSHKSDKIEALDPLTGVSTPLYHPRNEIWSEHFEWMEGYTMIRGKTPQGRATVEALTMNDPDMVLARRLWVLAGWHPPKEE